MSQPFHWSVTRLLGGPLTKDGLTTLAQLIAQCTIDGGHANMSLALKEAAERLGIPGHHAVARALVHIGNEGERIKEESMRE